MEVEKADSCVVICMRRGENRLNPEFIREFHQALDQAESYEDAKSLVTIGEGKCFSLGLEPALIGLLGTEYLEDTQKLLARIISLPLVTIAAVNGHMYAGGAGLGLAHDYVIMSTEKGWFRLSEVWLRMPHPAGYVELFKARIPLQQHNLAIALGKRYTGEEAHRAGIVNEVCSLEELKETAIAAANRLAGEGLDRLTLSTIKHDLHRNVYKTLMEPVKFYSEL